MTTLALQSLNFSTSLLEKIGRGFKKTFKGIMIGYMLARQSQANEYIARQLIHEYPNHTIESLTHELNIKTLNHITKEFG